jgi:hypothetical protein
MYDMVRKPKEAPKVALYVRVSTSEQNTRNQRRDLKAVAARQTIARILIVGFAKDAHSARGQAAASAPLSVRSDRRPPPEVSRCTAAKGNNELVTVV